jgi:hypothetical protein
MTTAAGEPVPGDYFVTATKGPLLDRIAARIIQWDTDSPVNHAGLYVGDGTIVEAVGRVRYGDIAQYPDAIWSTHRLPPELTPSLDQRRLIVNAARSLVGRKYNWLDILAIGLAQRRMGDLVDSRTWWARRVSDDSCLICSQAVDEEFLAAGINLFADGRLPGLVSPNDLLQLLEPATG